MKASNMRCFGRDKELVEFTKSNESLLLQDQVKVYADYEGTFKETG